MSRALCIPFIIPMTWSDATSREFLLFVFFPLWKTWPAHDCTWDLSIQKFKRYKKFCFIHIIFMVNKLKISNQYLANTFILNYFLSHKKSQFDTTMTNDPETNLPFVKMHTVFHFKFVILYVRSVLQSSATCVDMHSLEGDVREGTGLGFSMKRKLVWSKCVMRY